MASLEVKTLFLFIIFVMFVSRNYAKDRMIDSNPFASVPSLIRSEGYSVERHSALTGDGYRLELQRIPRPGGRPALIVHGMLGASGDFVLLGTNRSIAFMLADRGYDVWLGNMRGTDTSSHVKYEKNNIKFWDYSFEHHGLYDVPAFIDYILNATGQEKLVYIGHSMGTTSHFIMLSERPEYNDKVLAFFALAPAVYMDNLRDLVRMVMGDGRFVDEMRARGYGSLALPRYMRELATQMCRTRSRDNLCLRFLSGIVGEDTPQVDWEVLPIYIARAQPAAFGELLHFAKVALKGDFITWGEGMHDMDVRTYNLTNVKIPVEIYYGENDLLTAKEQIMRLAKGLNLPKRSIHRVPWRKFNHLDFIFARNLDRLLNNDLVERIDAVCSDSDDATNKLE